MQIPLLHRYTQLMMLKKQIKQKARHLKKYKLVARARWRKVRQIRSDLLEELRQLIDTQQKNYAKLKRVRARHSLNDILIVYKRWLRRWTKLLKMQRQQLEQQQKKDEQYDRRLSQLKTKLSLEPNHKKLVDKCFTKLRQALKGWMDSPERDTAIEGTVHTWEKEVEAIRKYLMDFDWLKTCTRNRVKKTEEKPRISGFSLFWDMEMQGKKSKWLPMRVTPRQSGLDEHKLIDQPKRKPKKTTRKRSPKTQQVEMNTDLKKGKKVKRAPSLKDIENLFKLLIDDGTIEVGKPHKIKKKKKLKKPKQNQIRKRCKLQDREATIEKFLKPKKLKGSKIKSIIRRKALNEKKSLGLFGCKKRDIKFSGQVTTGESDSVYEEKSQLSLENPLSVQSKIKPAEKLGFNAEQTKYLKDLEVNTRLAKIKRPGQGKTADAVPLLVKKGKGSHRSSLKPPTPKDFESELDTLEMPSSEVSVSFKKTPKKIISKLGNAREKGRTWRQASHSTLISWESYLENQAMGDGPQSKTMVKFGTGNKDKHSQRIALDGHSVHSSETIAGETSKVIFNLDEMNSQEKYKPIQHFLKETIEQNSLLKAVPDSKALMKVVEKHHMWKNLNGLHDEMEAAGFSVGDMLSILKDKYMQYLNEIVTDVIDHGDVVSIRGQEVVRLSGKITHKAKFSAGLHYRELKPHIKPWGKKPSAIDIFTVTGRPRATSDTKLKSSRINSWLEKVANETEEKKSHMFDEIASENNAASVEDLVQLDAYVDETGQPVESFWEEGETENKMDLQLTQSQLEHEERIQRLLSNNQYNVKSISSIQSIRGGKFSAKVFGPAGLIDVEKRYSPTNLREVLAKYKNFFESRRKSPFLKELENRKRLHRQHLKMAVSKVGFKVRKAKLNWRRHLRKPQNLRSTENSYYAPRKTCRGGLTSDEECSECGEILEQDQKPCTWEKCPRCGVEVPISETLSAGSIEACAKNNLIRSVTKDICLRCGFVHKKGSPCLHLGCPAKPNPLSQLQRIRATAKGYPESKPPPPKQVPKFCSPCGKWKDIWRNSSFAANAASLSSTGR
ncbi:uncharacterized protein [Drosophila tropicalis]|uniref:uncharacterized protein n=1 Tax=Drosophila tropicalis TaxID=46794 RepID=UPI0035ABE2F0